MTFNFIPFMLCITIYFKFQAMAFPMNAALVLSSRFRIYYVVFSLSMIFLNSVIWIYTFPLTRSCLNYNFLKTQIFNLFLSLLHHGQKMLSTSSLILKFILVSFVVVNGPVNYCGCSMGIQIKTIFPTVRAHSLIYIHHIYFYVYVSEVFRVFI